MRIITIGAGIVGTSLAYSLVNRGHEVTLVEANAVAAGTTSTTYAWINSHKKYPDSYHALNLNGLLHWKRVISSEQPEVVEFGGHVEFAVDQEHRNALAQRLVRLQKLSYPARWITLEEGRQRASVEIPEDAVVGFFPWEGHAYPDQLTQSRVQRMNENPAFTLILDAVVSVSRLDGRVELASGDTLSADVIVLATGAETSHLAATAGVSLPMIDREVGGATFGYLAYVNAPGHQLRGPVTTDRLNLRPNGKDGLILQALDMDNTANPREQPTPDVGRRFMTRLEELLPDRQAHLHEVRVGTRVIPGDGLTVAGAATDESENRLWVAVTHSGVVLGPWVGEALADEICNSEPNPLLEDFRPTRFSNAGRMPPYTAPRRPGDQ